MRERPILFSVAMVQAILAGRKTQTRRIVKEKMLQRFDLAAMLGECSPLDAHHPNDQSYFKLFCPYGDVGDQLWVRETFLLGRIDEWDAEHPDDRYLFIDQCEDSSNYPIYKQYCLANDVRIDDVTWKPSIHMPREAARILLEITEVRIERLQEITDEDAKLEGAKFFADIPTRTISGESLPVEEYRRWSMENPEATDQCLGGAKYAFVNYFCKINGKASKNTIDLSPWESNPWVWVISFKVLEPSA